MALSLPGLNMLGIFGFLIEWIMGAVGTVLTVVMEITLALFARFLYIIGSQLLSFVDFIQSLFRKLAGMDAYWYKGVKTGQEGGPATEDPILKFITDPDVLQVLVAMTIVAVALLIMFTVVQIIRVEFTTEGAKNTKGNIIGQSLKALAMFLLVPVSVGFGLTASNFVLRSLDAATNVSGGSTIAGFVFKAAASEANYVRRFNPNPQNDWDDWGKNLIDKLSGISNTITVSKEGDGRIVINEGANNNGAFVVSGYTTDAEAIEALATLIDNAFASKAENNNTDSTYKGAIVHSDLSVVFHFDYTDPYNVSMYYSLRAINYLVLFAASIVIIYVLFNALFGMIMRIYKALILFMVAPPIVAMMPLDGGNAFKQWRQSFLSAVLGAYGVVVGLNLFTLIIGLIGNITLFPATFFYSYYNNYVHMIFVLVGCFMIKDIIGMLVKLIGADDAFSAGSAVSGKVMSAATTVATGGATHGAKALLNVGKAAVNMGGAAGSAGKAIALKIGKGKKIGGLAATRNKKSTELLDTFKNDMQNASQLKGNARKRAEKQAKRKYNDGEMANREEYNAGVSLVDTEIKNSWSKAGGRLKKTGGAVKKVAGNVASGFAHVTGASDKKNRDKVLNAIGVDTGALDKRKKEIKEEREKNNKKANDQFSPSTIKNKTEAAGGLIGNTLDALKNYAGKGDNSGLSQLKENLESVKGVMDSGFEKVADELIRLVQATIQAGKAPVQAQIASVQAKADNAMKQFSVNSTLINNAIDQGQLKTLSDKLQAEFVKVASEAKMDQKQIEQLLGKSKAEIEAMLKKYK